MNPAVGRRYATSERLLFASNARTVHRRSDKQNCRVHSIIYPVVKTLVCLSQHEIDLQTNLQFTSSDSRKRSYGFGTYLTLLYLYLPLNHQTAYVPLFQGQQFLPNPYHRLLQVSPRHSLRKGSMRGLYHERLYHLRISLP